VNSGGATGARVVALAHRFRDLGPEWKVLEPLGVELIDAGALAPDEALALAAEADAILLGTRLELDRERIGLLRRCRVIARYGTGVDNVDVVAAHEHGIVVTSVPDYCIEEVSNHAIALLLALHRRILDFDRAVRAGAWGSPSTEIRRLSRCSLGVVGFGRIGREVVRKARALDLQVLVSDLAVSEEAIRMCRAQPVALETLVEESDFVSLHLPLTSSTRHIFDAATIARMKAGAVLVNVSRGGLIDELALADALGAGRLAGAALDTAEREPLDADHPLLRAPNLIVTPHVAWMSDGAREQLQLGAAQEVARVLQDLPAVNRVPDPPRCRRCRRFGR